MSTRALAGLLLCNGILPAVAEEQGLPFIAWYPPQVYAAGTQNWAITQGADGLMYFGNDGVILRFDGSRWDRIPVSPGRAVRSLGTAVDGRILVGSQSEFGYLEQDADGTEFFVSLSAVLPPEAPAFTDVWQSIATDQAWYFSTPQALFWYADGRLGWHEHASPGVGGSFWVHGRLYTDTSEGLIVLGDPDYRPAGEQASSLHLYAMLPASDGRILLGTRQQGLFLFDPASGEVESVAAEASAWLAENQVYHGTALVDGRFALGTLRGGIALIDLERDEWEIIGAAEGLPDIRVRHLYSDRDGGLWLALDSGLARLEPQSPITRWNDRLGLNGPVLSLIREQDRLYAGTTLGLFVLDQGRFQPIDGIDSEVWDLHVWTPQAGRRQLLAATSYGVFEVEQDQARLVSEPYLAMTLNHTPGRPERLWVGTYDQGLGYIEAGQDSDAHSASTRFTAIQEAARALDIDADGKLWLSTWLDGVLRIDPADGEVLWRYPQPGDDADGTGLAVLVNDRFQLLSSREGIWQWIEPDELVGREDLRPLLAHPLSGSAELVEGQPGTLWSIATDGITHRIRAAQPEHPDQPVPIDALLGRLPDLEFYVIYPDGEDQVWIGGSDALYRIDLTRPVLGSERFEVQWRSIQAGQRRLPLSVGMQPMDLDPDQDFPLRFEYAAPNFDWPAGNQFRYRLTPLQSDWSSWHADAQREFSHLPHGHYRFEVQARNVYGQIDTSRAIEFRVPPPWYLDPVHLWVGGAALLMLMPLLLWLGGWRQARRNATLETLVADRTHALSEQQRLLKHERDRLEHLSQHDELTGLANRRHGRQRLEDAFSQAAGQGSALSLALLDVDHFKRINDHHGHEIGDRVLIELAGLLKQHCRPDDLVARWGGEEFLLLFPGTSLPDAAAVCHRISDLIRQHPWSELGIDSTVSVSIGLTACHGQHGPNRLLSRADELLYGAKQSGRDRVEVDRENW